MDEVHVFVADTAGVVQDAGLIDAAMVDAMTLLRADKMPEQMAADLIVASRKGGQDPEAFARHLLKLRAEWRRFNQERGTCDG